MIRAELGRCAERLTQLLNAESPQQDPQAQDTLTRAEETIEAFANALDKIKRKEVAAEVQAVFEEIDQIRRRVQHLRKTLPDLSAVKINNGTDFNTKCNDSPSH